MTHIHIARNGAPSEPFAAVNSPTKAALSSGKYVGQRKVNGPLLILLFALTGCHPKNEAWRDEYLAAGDRWAVAYGDPDARVSYEATKSFIEHLKKMERDGRPFEYAKVQTWNYARLALLADHLGRKEEAAQLFTAAATCAKIANPDEPENRISEAAFRSYLDEMDTPDKVAWRKK